MATGAQRVGCGGVDLERDSHRGTTATLPEEVLGVVGRARAGVAAVRSTRLKVDRRRPVAQGNVVGQRHSGRRAAGSVDRLHHARRSRQRIGPGAGS